MCGHGFDVGGILLYVRTHCTPISDLTKDPVMGAAFRVKFMSVTFYLKITWATLNPDVSTRGNERF